MKTVIYKLLIHQNLNINGSGLWWCAASYHTHLAVCTETDNYLYVWIFFGFSKYAWCCMCMTRKRKQTVCRYGRACVIVWSIGQRVIHSYGAQTCLMKKCRFLRILASRDYMRMRCVPRWTGSCLYMWLRASLAWYGAARFCGGEACDLTSSSFLRRAQQS